ncbi:DUF2779 domain-containing protein [Erythrobacter litoralis]|uniref:DUF2779 domain-containing protein n=1 Tax=Erythrobacter litoralis TaxID=39960 RepID=UPI0024348170|nr:DUF2779 domain-containing protein [Erythrobacter litoralis]MDG6079030.1 DUF2779 domain-containing protein [Erythrobacter litoralis]
MKDTTQILTKSGFLDFLHCPTSFWLARRRPDLYVAPAPSEFDRLLMMDGYAVEAAARDMLGAGIDSEAFDFQFDFASDGCLARADAVRRLEDGRIEIYEIKSSTSANDHIQDAAFQRIVAERSGHRVAASFVVHVEKNYRLDGQLDPEAFLTITPVDEDIEQIRHDTETAIDRAMNTLAATDVDLDGCDCVYKSKAQRCSGFDQLNPEVPDPSVYDLPRMHGARLAALVDDGRLDIEDVVEEDVTASQLPVLRALRSGECIVDAKAIRKFLGELEFPLHFYDYETAGGAIPQAEGHGPHQQIPTQFSCHVVHEDGSTQHHEFLAHGHGQEAQLVEALKACVASSGSMIVWNETFEKACNRRMAALLPQHEEFLFSLNERTVDLMKPFKAHYVHPDFRGSTSIKRVLPVLCPELSYDEEAVHDGTGAILAFREMVESTSHEQVTELRRQLLGYCRLDTEAMVAIYRKLCDAVA